MTYLPTHPVSSTPDAGPLSDADLLPLVQTGVTRRTTLAAVKAFVLGGATGSTSATGSTGYGVHTFDWAARVKPAAMAANCPQPARMVLGPGGL